MSHSADQLDRMLGEARRMPHGRARIAAVEEVIRHADAQHLAELQYAARILAMHAYVRGGEPRKVFVPFAWCLAAHDAGTADPRYDHQLMWSFKEIVGALRDFPEVPLAQTVAVLDDMERRYRLAGHTMGPVHNARCRLARHLGDLDTAREQYRLWRAVPRGEMSDCAGCEATWNAHHLGMEGRDEDAVAGAAPVLAGELRCEAQPQDILTTLLLPYLRTGRLAEAADAHRRAYRLIQGNRNELSSIADHVVFCARSGNEARAVELVQRHVGWIDEPPTPSAEMEFCAAAALALRRAGELGRGDVSDRHGDAPVGADELAARAVEIAARFDARNGTSHQGEQVRATLTAQPLVDHLPLSGAVRRAARLAPATDPLVPDLPASPEELADFAERQARLHNQQTVDAAWARFDQLCPEPGPVLRGRRLVAVGSRFWARAEQEAASDAWNEAVAVLDGVDEIRAHATRQRLGLALCRAGQTEAGLRQVLDSGAVIEAAGSVDERCEALARIAWAHMMCEEADEALAVALRAVELAEAGASVLARADAARILASVSSMHGPDRYDEAMRQAEHAIALYATLEPSEAVQNARLTAGWMRAETGDLRAAYDLLDAPAQSADEEVRVRALHLRGVVALESDRPDQAVEAFADAVAVLTTAGEEVRAAHAAIQLAEACLAARRPDQAAEAAEEAIAALTDLEALAQAKYLLSQAYHQLGRPEQALALLDEAAEANAELGNAGGLGQARGVAADTLDELDRDALAAQRYEQAADAFAEAGDELRELHNRRRAALSWHWAGEVERSLAGVDAAERCAAVVDTTEPRLRWELAMLRYDVARILSAADRPEAAVEHAGSAAELFAAMEAPLPVAMAESLRGRILADLGRVEEARAALGAALEALPEDETDRRKQIEELLAGLPA
jgi:tetratricopeptide (TPR) repeat protein